MPTSELGTGMKNLMRAILGLFQAQTTAPGTTANTEGFDLAVFSAMDDACPTCRQLDGIETTPGSADYRRLEPPVVGCTHPGGCRCTWVLSSEYRPPLPVADAWWDPHRAFTDAVARKDYVAAVQHFGDAAAAGLPADHKAYGLRSLGELAEPTDKAAALRYCREALAIDPRVGVKRRADALEKAMVAVARGERRGRGDTTQ